MMLFRFFWGGVWGKKFLPGFCLPLGSHGTQFRKRQKARLQPHFPIKCGVRFVRVCDVRRGILHSSRRILRWRSLFVVLVPLESSVLLVLVLRDEVANVLVSLLELHLVHALSLVPGEERLSLVHRA